MIVGARVIIWGITKCTNGEPRRTFNWSHSTDIKDQLRFVSLEKSSPRGFAMIRKNEEENRFSGGMPSG
jgi:hypothetical protein